MNKLFFFWKELIATFWFVPVLIILIAIIFSVGLVYIDGIITLPLEGLGRFLFVVNVDSARSILSTISGAMIGVAGTVFSITLVTLTLASSQFGARLIKNFMYDRLNQVVLGTYIANFIYCLLLLNAVKDGEEVFVPSLSILMAQIVAVANIILLIIFIHHVAVSIQADHVISNISDALSKNIKVLFPEMMGEEPEEEDVEDIEAVKNKYAHQCKLNAPKNGYIQYIDSESILKEAEANDALLELHYRPGDYLVEGMEMGRLYAKEELHLDIFQEQIIIGKTRKGQQDAEFSIHQMVEIASRALSPGVNDPYTAIACIDNLCGTLSYLTHVRFPSKYRLDEEGELRVITEPITYEGMLNASFNQIRQYASNSPSVIIRLMESLIIILSGVKQPKHREALIRHAKMVLNTAEQNFQDPNDLEDLKKRSRKIIQE